MRLSPFRSAIWCFSASEMGHFASRNGAFCKKGKYPLKLNYWYSVSYEKRSKSAYLRPKESRSATTRLFFGVEYETKTEKTKCGYKLKAVLLFHPIRRKQRRSGLEAAVFIVTYTAYFPPGRLSASLPRLCLATVSRSAVSPTIQTMSSGRNL